jgi:isoquinoline 1-oxidoreductase beta subunit
MGQGVHTALAMLVAEELEARWEQVRVEDPPEDVVYRNVEILIDGLPFSPEQAGTVVDVAHWVAGKLGGVLGVAATGGSTTVRDAWVPLRTAGAVARELLVQAASRKSGVPAAELVAVEGAIRRRDGSAVARFGELVDFVGDLGAMAPPPLKPASQFKLIGKPLPRLDIPAKVAGAATFGIDVRQPGQVYAAVRHAPTFGGEVASFSIKGTKPKEIDEVVIVPGGIAAIGRSWWSASRFLDERLEVQWRDGPEPKLDSATLWKRYEGLIDSDPALTRTLGKEPAAPGGQKLEAVYRAPYLAHAPMEPMNCTALFTGSRSSSGCPISRRP